MSRDLVIVGGAYAAVQIAAAARAAGFAEPIRLVSAEPHLPYQRPPLSKGFLLGKVEADALPQRAAAFYRENAIDLVLGAPVEALDRQGRAVFTADGRRIPYGTLALATGARPRLLMTPGGELDGVLTLRTLDDSRAIRERLSSVGTAVVVGGGYIGLEVAAALATLGKKVTVIEAQGRLLARAASAPLADLVAEAHRARGVELRFHATLARIDGAGGRVRSVETADGARLPADLVVIGIGVVPESGIAEAAGLPCQDGILVDRHTRTADPAILAAGDCVRHPNPFAGRALRLESVQHAVDQGKVAGAVAAGREASYDAVPWFWSDQYDLKLQSVGLADGYDRHVVRGAPEGGRFSIFYFRGDRLIAVDSVNRPGEHMTGRKLLAGATALTPAEAADPGFDLASRVAPAG
ncbi:MAG: NAD(P)/FAD-dependent oxidoreductase [Alphaproteobacteria bacterium]